jgi:hypothetical protein
MLLSMSAVESVVHRAWYVGDGFGLMLDGAAIFALGSMYREHKTRAAEEAAAEAAAEARARAGQEAAAEAAERAAAEAAAQADRDARERAAGQERRAADRLARAEAKRRGVDPDAKADAARRYYRAEHRAGNKLSDRALGDHFEKSRTWGASRIREVEGGPKLTDASTG